MLGVFRVLYIVAGISSSVIVSRSASVPFLIFLLSLVSSLSVFPRSLSSCLIVLSCSQWPCHNRMCIIAKRRRAVSTGSRMQRDAVLCIQHTGDNFVPVNASSNCISTRVSRTAMRQERTSVSGHFESETSTRQFNHTN